MASLNVKELTKHGGHRIDIFLKKVEKEDPFILIDGSQVFIDPYGFESKYSLDCFYRHDLKPGTRFKFNTDRGILGLGRFKKTEEFGSLNTSGRTQKHTEAVEEATAFIYMCSRDGNICSLKHSPEEVWQNYSASVLATQDLEWQQTVQDSADLISQTYKPGIVHYQDSTVSFIRDCFKWSNDQAGKPFGDINKWNPADVWYTSSTIQTASLQSRSLQELTDELDQLYDRQELVGISLKKRTEAGLKLDHVKPKIFNVTGLNFIKSEIGQGYIKFTVQGRTRTESGILKFNLRPAGDWRRKPPQVECNCYMDGANSKSGQINSRDKVEYLLGLEKGWFAETWRNILISMPWMNTPDQVRSYLVNYRLFPELEHITNNLDARIGNLIAYCRSQYLGSEARSCKYDIIH